MECDAATGNDADSISTQQRINHYNAAMTTANKDIVHVTQDSQLPAALALLAPSEFVVVDTEFLREKTYFAKLCLVQLATDNAIVVVDVLAPNIIAPLLDFL